MEDLIFKIVVGVLIAGSLYLVIQLYFPRLRKDKILDKTGLDTILDESKLISEEELRYEGKFKSRKTEVFWISCRNLFGLNVIRVVHYLNSEQEKESFLKNLGSQEAKGELRLVDDMIILDINFNFSYPKKGELTNELEKLDKLLRG